MIAETRTGRRKPECLLHARPPTLPPTKAKRAEAMGRGQVSSGEAMTGAQRGFSAHQRGDAGSLCPEL